MDLSNLIRDMERDFRDSEFDLDRAEVLELEKRPEQQYRALRALDQVEGAHQILDRWDRRLIEMELFMERLEELEG